MSLQVPRMSAFTFQSAGHSAHVLQCLDEQRQRDVLCDVTVVVEDRSFRAHCSVLASCGDYFHSRFTNVPKQNSTVHLPHEVTVEGFEPLLQFAYTSKLIFTRENIQAVHTSAGLLGFHNLETACFDFLIPKFSESCKGVRRRRCCQNRTPGVDSNPIVHGNSSKSQESHSSVASVQIDFSSQCPENIKGQIVGIEQEHFSLENCGPQMTPLSLGLTAGGVCPILAIPCPEANRTDCSTQFCETAILELGRVCDQSELGLVDCALPCELASLSGVDLPDLRDLRDLRDQTVESLAAETNCNHGSCPLEASGGEHGSGLLEQSDGGPDESMTVDLEEGFGERSSVEREVAEHLAKGFWPDLCPSQTQPIPLDPVDQSSLAKATDFHWLKQLDLSSSTADCPFLRELGAEGEQPPGADGLIQSEESPYMSSLNSGEDDSDLDTDGDAEANKKRAEEVQLPFPVEQISALSRSAFQQLLRRQQLTQDQLEFVHDVRRRSKNRVAAQRCRKRKLDGIHILECEINTLRGEKERLIHERSQLEQNMEETRQSLSGLCKSVGVELGPEQDQLQLLAKLSSSADFPLSALLTPVSSPRLPGKDTEAVSCPSECCDLSGPTAEQLDAQGDRGASPQSRDPASSLNACLHMNSSV